MLPIKRDPATHTGEYSSSARGIGPVIFHDLRELIQEFVNGSETLDHGCDYGNSTTLMLESLGLQVDVLNQTGGAILCSDERYDFVFSCFGLVTISDRKELFDTVVEIARVMKKGGTFMTLVNHDKDDAHNEDGFIMPKLEDEEDLNGGGAVVKTVISKDICSRPIVDYFWRHEDYKAAMKNAELIIERVHQSHVPEEDAYSWSLEKASSPVVIYVARKL